MELRTLWISRESDMNEWMSVHWKCIKYIHYEPSPWNNTEWCYRIVYRPVADEEK